MTGKTEWFIPDMYWPEADRGSYASHEAVCVLNPGAEDITVEITLYFEDRAPLVCRSVVCPAGRTRHIRTDGLLPTDGSGIPRGVGYAGAVRCSGPAVVQYTRVDTTQEPLALMTTMAY